MEVITIESATFKALEFKIEENLKTTQAIYAKLADKIADSWLSPEAAAQYTGFKKDWIIERAERIGFFKDGKGLRFKRSNLDKYMEANSVHRK